MHAKKVLSNSKEKKQASNLRLLVENKRIKQDCHQVFEMLTSFFSFEYENLFLILWGLSSVVGL
jgi:hypothetical protein